MMNWINCKLCENKYNLKNSYYRHVRSMHPESVAEICINKPGQDCTRTHYFICSICDQRFFRKDLLKTHIFSAHKIRKQQQKIETCKLCANKYCSKDAYYKHVRSKHPESVAEICITKRQKKIIQTCKLCASKYSSRDSYYKHVRSKHPESVAEICTPKKRKKILCAFENCNVHLSNYKLYYDHLLIHEIEIKEKIMIFGNRSDFVQWKEKYELQHNVSFIRRTGKRLNKSLSATVEYYSCHRSYEPIITTGRKIKFRGSRKTGVCCPSQMRAIVKKSETVVYFSDTHLGHSCDPGKLSLNPTEKQNIAKKLSDGMSFERILEDIKHSTIIYSEIKRIHLTDKQDLHNICKEFNVSAAIMKDQNDFISVKMLIEEMRASENNPVLYVKFQHEDDPVFKEEDFVLVLMTKFQKDMYLKFGNDIICIDGTHGLNSYDFYLYSLVIIDEFGNGVPIAFCFSNLNNNLVYKIFFNSIKTQVGTVSPRVFMSDSEVALYSAWESVMGAVECKLLCSWHIFKNWTENLSKIVTNKYKREMIKKVLRTLCYILNPEKFEICLQNFLEGLENDEDTRSFYIYFKEEWYSKQTQWALCHRKYVGISTNMVLESLYKRIKYFYLSGLTCKRLDKSINALIKLTNDDVFNQLIKLYRHTSSGKTTCISKAHKSSTDIKDENIVLITNNLWSVLSTSKKDFLYEVAKINDTCPENFCGLKCSPCNICKHMYLCTCSDSVIRLNICKHIHAVCRVTSSPVNQHVQENEDLQPAENEIIVYVSGMMEDNMDHQEEDIMDQLLQIIPTNNVDMKLQVLSKLSKLTEILNQIEVLPSENEETRQLNSYLDSALTAADSLLKKSFICLQEKRDARERR